MSTTAVPVTHLRAVDLVRVASLGLRARRVRTGLSCLGIAIGIAAMVAVVGIAGSSKANLVAQLDQLGTDLLTVAPGTTIDGTPARLPATAPAMIRRIDGVYATTATGATNATVLRTNLMPVTETGGIAVIAAQLDLVQTLHGTIADGEFLNRATERYPATVLGAAAAQQLGISTVLPRQRVWIANQWFDVVGILRPLPLAPEIDSSVLVGFPISEHSLHFDGSLADIYVRAKPASIPAVHAVVADTAFPAHPEEVLVSRPSAVLAARAVTSQALTSLLLALGAVALVVGGIGIANVMVIAVLERRSEIGLRRALGATRRHVATQFVTEALMLSALGGAAGVLLGEATTTAYAVSRSWGLSLPLYGALGGFAAAIATGVIAGAYPAMRAAHLAPTEALRSN